MIKRYNQYIKEDVYHGDFHNKPKQKNNTPIDSYDDAYDIFMQNVLPNYSQEQIPSEAVDGLRNYICELFDEGHIKTIGDMTETIDSILEKGWIHKYIDY